MIEVTRDIESPRGGWKLTVEKTGLTITAPFFTILKRKVASHMRANSIPLPDDFDAWCQDAACRETGLGRPFCGQPAPPVVAGMPSLTYALAARFLNTMLGVIRDRKFVDREEVERRAAICRACPLRVKTIGGCTTCKALLRKVGRAIEPYIVDDKLGWCKACGCHLPLKTLISNETLDRAETERPPYAEGCWRNEVT